MRWVVRRYGWVLVVILSLPSCGWTWDDRTSDTYWTQQYGTWNGSTWTAEYFEPTEKYYVWLDVDGGWNSTYFPVAVRLTFSGQVSLTRVRVYVTDVKSINTPDSTITSEQVMGMSFSVGETISKVIIISEDGEFIVSKIEFALVYNSPGNVLTGGVSR